jgi:hypothetical protein
MSASCGAGRACLDRQQQPILVPARHSATTYAARIARILMSLDRATPAVVLVPGGFWVFGEGVATHISTPCQLPPNVQRTTVKSQPPLPGTKPSRAWPRRQGCRVAGQAADDATLDTGSDSANRAAGYAAGLTTSRAAKQLKGEACVTWGLRRGAMAEQSWQTSESVLPAASKPVGVDPAACAGRRVACPVWGSRQAWSARPQSQSARSDWPAPSALRREKAPSPEKDPARGRA